MLKREEINRKLLHIVALLMPIGIFYVPVLTPCSKWTGPAVLAGLFTASIFLEELRLKNRGIRERFTAWFGTLMRQDEKQRATGATFIIGGALICSVVFVDSPHISFIVLTLFIIGDAAAALVGQSLGRIPIFGKSLEGSMACFTACMILFAVVFPHVPLLERQWQSGHIPISSMIVTSLAVTILELVPIRITKHLLLNDNLYVPVAAGLIMKGFTVLS
ncbi:MAG: hypothetical protein R6U50_17150 [Desulfobacterales bacterium]